MSGAGSMVGPREHGWSAGSMGRSAGSMGGPHGFEPQLEGYQTASSGSLEVVKRQTFCIGSCSLNARVMPTCVGERSRRKEVRSKDVGRRNV